MLTPHCPLPIALATIQTVSVTLSTLETLCKTKYFCVWLISLNVMSSQLTHIVAHVIAKTLHDYTVVRIFRPLFSIRPEPWSPPLLDLHRPVLDRILTSQFSEYPHH